MEEEPGEAKPLANIPNPKEVEEGISPAEEAKPTSLVRRASGDTRVHRFNLVAVGEEAKAFNFLAARSQKNRLTDVEAMVHLLKKCLGVGVTYIHHSYMKCGLWSALILNIAAGFMMVHSMYMLARSAQIAYGRTHVPDMTYPDIAEAAFDIGPFPTLRQYSRIFRYIVEGSLLALNAGLSAVCMILMAHCTDLIIEDSSYLSDNKTRIYVACFLIPCILICLIKTLKYLTPICLITDIFVSLIALFTMFYGISRATKSPFDFPILHSTLGMIQFLPYCTLCVEGMSMILPIENSMARPENIFKVLHLGMAYIVSIIIIMGFFGYLGFGENSKTPIIKNFPWSGSTMNLCISLVLILIVSFSLHNFTVFECLWFYFKRTHNPEKHYYLEKIYRSIVVTAIAIISIIFPLLLRYLPKILCPLSILVAFIYPAIIEFCIIYEDPGLGAFNWRLWKFFGLLSYGLFLIVVGSIYN